jgi:hypothetical protein
LKIWIIDIVVVVDLVENWKARGLRSEQLVVGDMGARKYYLWVIE